MKSEWKELKLQEGTELLHKEQFIYRIANAEYTIELFESHNGEYYAIGVPVHTDRLLIYGSSIVNDPRKALDQTIRKINRDVQQQDIQSIGEDARADLWED